MVRRKTVVLLCIWRQADLPPVRLVARIEMFRFNLHDWTSVNYLRIGEYVRRRLKWARTGLAGKLRVGKMEYKQKHLWILTPKNICIHCNACIQCDRKLTKAYRRFNVSTSISFRIPNELVKKLDNVSKETERPRSFIIQKALETYI